jgi:pimeloyl-ACP methyl ester carboxylesterase
MNAAIQKAYLPGENGQVHIRSLAASSAETQAPLLCLHPAPYSGSYFESVMPMINTGRRVVAPDYPGYGNSYPLTEPPSIGDYAAAMTDAVLGAEDSPKVDLLGFHSGCLVAAEIALRAPERVRKLLLIDVPFFDRETQKNFAGKVAKPMPMSHDQSCLDKAWEFNVASRQDIVPLERAFAMFVDQISSGVHDYFCFHAAFSYDCVARFPKIAVPTTLVATRSPLLKATHVAASAIPNATLIDDESIETSVFEQGASVIAGHIRSILDDD